MVSNNGFEANLQVKTNELIGFTKKTYITSLYRKFNGIFPELIFLIFYWFIHNQYFDYYNFLSNNKLEQVQPNDLIKCLLFLSLVIFIKKYLKQAIMY